MPRVLRASIFLVLLATACDPEPPQARLELSDMADGSVVPIVFGPQGGYHIDVGVRIYGLDPEGAALRYEVWEPDGARSYHAEATYALRTFRLIDAGDHYARGGDRAILEITDPAELDGRTLDVSAILELADGSRYEDVRTVTLSRSSP